MIGVWVNCATVVIGGILGTLLRGGIQERYRKTIHAGLTLCVMLIGVSGAIKTSSVMIAIVSIVIDPARTNVKVTGMLAPARTSRSTPCPLFPRRGFAGCTRCAPVGPSLRQASDRNSFSSFATSRFACRAYSVSDGRVSAR